MKRLTCNILVSLLSLILLGSLAAQQDEDGHNIGVSWKSPNYLTLCYHDLPLRPSDDRYAVDVFSFVAELEYMRDAGCHFISLDDIEKAEKGKTPLPDKAVLFTFDDAYQSFYKNVFPLLKLYHCPAILAVVPHWSDEVPSEIEYRKGIMTPAQIKEMSDSGIVEIAGHSFDSHKSVVINPQGNTGPAFTNRIYDPKTKSYETDEAYVLRVRDDLNKCRKALIQITGKAPRSFMWPYGRYSGISLKEAGKAGFAFLFTLDDGLANTTDNTRIPRHMLEENPSITQFVEGFGRLFAIPPHLRIAEVSLDLIYDPDTAAQERKLDRFLDRLAALHPSGVYLHAFSDARPESNIKALYFPNGVMPMKADLLNRVSRCLLLRGIKTYVCMPLLRLEDKEGHQIDPLTSEGAAKLERLYYELGASSMFNGVVFEDDGFLNLTREAEEEALLALTAKLKERVFEYNPVATFARTLYVSASDEQASRERFDRSYSKYLAAYDFTVLLCCPEEEGLWFRERWLKSVVAMAKAHPQSLPKTIFNVQAYDWRHDKWIDSDTLQSWLRAILAEGAFSAGYFPDDFQAAKPELKELKPIISYEDFPFNK